MALFQNLQNYLLIVKLMLWDEELPLVQRLGKLNANFEIRHIIYKLNKLGSPAIIANASKLYY